MWATVELGRPLFLVGGVVLFGLGTVMGAAGHIDWAAWAWGQGIVTTSQLMTHYANDYFDVEHDKAHPAPTFWSGGSRVLPEGRLSLAAARTMATFFGGLALLLTALLAITRRPAPLVVGLALLGMGLAWQYSAPPLRLHSRGLGELTAALIVTGITPLMAYNLQAGRLDVVPVLVCLPLMCLQFAMLFTVEFPDAQADTLSGKGTLVVRLGFRRAGWLYSAALIAAYGLLLIIRRWGVPELAAAALAIPAPLAVWQAWRVGRGAGEDPDRWGSLAFWGIGLLIGTAGLGVIGFAVVNGLI